MTDNKFYFQCNIKRYKIFIRTVDHSLLLRCKITYNRPLNPVYGNATTNANARITKNYFEMSFLLSYLYASVILAGFIAIPTIGIILVFQSIPLVGLGIAITIHSIILMYSKMLSNFVLGLTMS
jgi:hypothetical protein